MRARNHGMTRDPADFVNTDDAFDADGTPNPWYYELVEPEFNWRANDIQCALGLSQLGKLGRFVARRRAIGRAYTIRCLPPLAPLLRPLARTRPCLPAWHLYVARIDFEACRHLARRIDARAGRRRHRHAGALLSRCIASPIMRSAMATPQLAGRGSLLRARA